MNSFPSRLLTSERRHGGLGIIPISIAAHERKRKVLLELVNKKGAEGIAAQALLANALRASKDDLSKATYDLNNANQYISSNYNANYENLDGYNNALPQPSQLDLNGQKPKVPGKLPYLDNLPK